MKILSPGSAYAPGQTPYDIFKDRMTAISSIATGIKNIIANKYINKQNAMIAENIQTAIDEQKAIDLSNLILSPPPEEIYPANLEDTVSQFYDKFAMGPMMQKEIMMGNLPAPEPKMGPMMQKEIMTGGLLAVGGVTPTAAPTTEAMIPKMDMYQLYNVIKDLPTGDITWDNIYKKMTEKKPFWMGTTAPEQYVLNQMLGQVKDPRSKIESDINLVKLVDETFAPEEEKVTSEIDMFMRYRNDWHELQEAKAMYKGETRTAWEIKVDTLIDWRNKNMISEEELKKGIGIHIAPEKKSDWEKKFDILMQLNPSSDEVKKFLNAYISEEGPKAPTYYVAENIEKGFMEKVENITDFTNELKRLKGLNIDTSTFETTEYFAGLIKKKYDEAIGVIQYCMWGISHEPSEAEIKKGATREADEEGLNYRDTYKEWWEKLRSYEEQYFMVTGERLLKGE